MEKSDASSVVKGPAVSCVTELKEKKLFYLHSCLKRDIGLYDAALKLYSKILIFCLFKILSLPQTSFTVIFDQLIIKSIKTKKMEI